ncbi:MAG: PilZ domain-containing protein [Deltaproteobacteria bacterium]|nr:PilZ domain-containing protein [Deltaproteobacteria bacterium]
MSANTARLALDSDARTEPRDRVVHIVEFSPFPRRRANERRHIGFTQDCSTTGFGLDLSEPLRSGDLLRVTLRDIDGGAALDGLARVVWCRLGDVARYRAGLVLIRDGARRVLARKPASTRRAARGPSSEPDLLD